MVLQMDYHYLSYCIAINFTTLWWFDIKVTVEEDEEKGEAGGGREWAVKRGEGRAGEEEEEMEVQSEEEEEDLIHINSNIDPV